MTQKTRKRLMDRKIVEALLQGKSMRSISKNFKVGDRRIKKIQCLAAQYGYLNESTPLPDYPEALFPDGPDGRRIQPSEPDSLLITKKDWIIERLKARWHPITVFEELGLPVSRSSFYRFLTRHGLTQVGATGRRRVVPEIIHQPGEALLLDWGKLRDVIHPETGKKKTLWVFVGVLGFSRYLMVRLVWSNDVVQTLTAIESMFLEIGGTPKRITSDNPKCFSIEASRYEPILNPAIERFAVHYKFMMECLPPADPEKKGKVERPMPYVRRLYEAHGESFQGIEESQTYLNGKIKIANQRVHGTTRMKPIEQFLNLEAKELKALPALAYVIEQVSEGKVRKDGHVRFENKYYSVPEDLIEKNVIILGNQQQVSLYHQGKLIEVHERIAETNALQSKSTKEHHRKPWERAMYEQTSYRKRAQTIGLDCDRLILILLNQGQGFIDLRKVWGILSLDKTYSHTLLNQACRQAIDLGSYSYQTVKRLLKLLSLVQLGPLDQPLNKRTKTDLKNLETVSHKFVRPMSVYEDQLKKLFIK